MTNSLRLSLRRPSLSLCLAGLGCLIAGVASAQEVELRYAPKKGQAFTRTLVTEQEQVVTLGPGKSATSRSLLALTFVDRVKTVDGAKQATVERTLKRVRMVNTRAGALGAEETRYDSDTPPGDSNPGAALVALQFSECVGKSSTFVLDPRGKIVSCEMPRVLGADVLEPGYQLLPEDAITVGQTWKEPGKDPRVSLVNRLETLEDRRGRRVAVIVLSGTLDRHDAREVSISGRREFDLTQGRLLEETVKVAFTVSKQGRRGPVSARVEANTCASVQEGTSPAQPSRAEALFLKAAKQVEQKRTAGEAEKAQRTPEQWVQALADASQAPFMEKRKRIQEAKRALVEHGEAALPFLKGFLEETSGSDFKQRDVRTAAAQALTEIGPSAVPVLVDLLASSDEGTQDLACEALARLGPEARAAIPALIPLLGPRRGPSRALAKIGIEAIPALQRIMVSGSEQQRTSAADTFGLMGPSGSPAVPDLVKAVETSASRLVRQSSIRALGRIGPAAVTGKPAILKIIKDRGRLTPVSMEALACVDPKGAVPVMVELLEEPRYATYAVGNLRKIGPQAAPAVPALAARVRTSRMWTQAADALGAIGPQAKEAVPALVERLDEKFPHAAIKALGAIGPGAKAAVPELQKLRSDPKVKRLVEAALQKID